MYFRTALVLISVIFVMFINGCASISSSPGVTATGESGEYLSVINKQVYFLNYTISSRNVVVRCNVKEDKCETLNLWTRDGWRIF